MKRLLIVASIAAGIAVVCVLSHIRVDKARNHINTHTNAVFTAVHQEDRENTLALIRELSDYWSQEQSNLIIFVRHAQVDEISRSFSRLETLAWHGDFQELSSELSIIRWQMNHIWESEMVRLKNIL